MVKNIVHGMISTRIQGNSTGIGVTGREKLCQEIVKISLKRPENSVVYNISLLNIK